jgi:hypothetical protein
MEVLESKIKKLEAEVSELNKKLKEKDSIISD